MSKKIMDRITFKTLLVIFFILSKKIEIQTYYYVNNDMLHKMNNIISSILSIKKEVIEKESKLIEKQKPVCINKEEINDEKSKLIENIKNEELIRSIDRKYKHKYYDVLSDEYLIKLGNNLIEEYKATPKSDPWHIYDQESNLRIKFEDNEYFNKKKPKEKKYIKSNIKQEYLNTIEKIQSYGIDICHVEKKLHNYFSGSESTCFRDGRVFILYCKKNNYKFVISYVDDCDCLPCILHVSDVIDMNTNELLSNYWCDLYNQNRDKIYSECFLTFINYKSKLEFMESRKEHLKNICDMLKDEKIIIKQKEKKLVKYHDVATLTDYNINIVVSCLTITCEKPSDDKYEVNDEICSFKHENYEITRNNLLNVIKYVSEKYGYLENGTYYNNETIRIFNENTKSKYYKKKYEIKELDINSVNNIDYTNKYYISKDIWHNSEKVACTQQYRVRICYDEKKDSENCYLYVEGLIIIENNKNVKPIFDIYIKKSIFSEVFNEYKSIIECINS